MMSNKLTLNLEKMHYVVFARKIKRAAHFPSLIELHYEWKKNLGVIIDSNSNWNYRVNHILVKLKSDAYFIQPVLNYP